MDNNLLIGSTFDSLEDVANYIIWYEEMLNTGGVTSWDKERYEIAINIRTREISQIEHSSSE